MDKRPKYKSTLPLLTLSALYFIAGETWREIFFVTAIPFACGLVLFLKWAAWVWSNSQSGFAVFCGAVCIGFFSSYLSGRALKWAVYRLGKWCEENPKAFRAWKQAHGITTPEETEHADQS